ncbi:MAG: hypothetical protein KAJ93_07995 [Methanosarcinales archaeon]|nr:hypothetical protein [Methanosarcinales archaeon]
MELKELDNKYLVLKWDDINNNLSPDRKHQLDEIIGLITHARATEGKLPQSYVVLNQSDDCDINYLSHKINQLREMWSQVSIQMMASDLINSIQVCNTDN